MTESHRINLIGLVLITAGIAAVMVIRYRLKSPEPDAKVWGVSTWQAMVSPGALSGPHAFLENNCNACHTPISGVQASSCIVCHANNHTLLQRQPTAFHADISSCVQCHREHQGPFKRPTEMDHSALTAIGLQQLESNPDPNSEDRMTAQQLTYWLGGQDTDHPPGHPALTANEMVLDCAACHKNDDRHFELFGNNCASCHATSAWTIPQFRHPPAASMDCAQCHQAPPSHYMMHFKMISQKVAGRPHANVEQCYKCHQTTSWPDIKDVGWYKHH